MRSAALAAALAGLALPAAGAEPSFSWASIQPSESLVYHACYDGELQCARLLLPLDWKLQPRSGSADAEALGSLATAGNRTVALAVIKLPAVVDAANATYAGPLVTNPGGPGTSGIDFVRAYGRRIRTLADKPGSRHYDIVSFDPRGIANSWPRADCFAGDALAHDAFDLTVRAMGPLDISDKSRSVPFAMGLYTGYGARCLAADAAGPSIMPYMGTPNVARDMVALVDAMDALHRKITAHPSPGDGGDGPARLRYVGFSYGTVIGNFFASLFPGRVGRLVLDGVVDVSDHVAAAGWTKSSIDADRIVDAFVSGCYEAGPQACALARAGDSSSSHVKGRLQGVLDRLATTPRAVSDPETGNDLVLTDTDVRQFIASTLYMPTLAFRGLAAVLNATLAGDTSALLAGMHAAGLAPPRLRDSCRPVDASQPTAPLDPNPGVLCIDSEPVTGKDVSWWRRYVGEQMRASSFLGNSWSLLRLPCVAWPFRPAWLFQGPFTSPAARRSPAGEPVSGIPAAPILFLSNRLDPATPLTAARTMAAIHPDARLVIQEALGHCALGSADSKCTKTIFADYLDSGRLPNATETVCNDIPCGPWDNGCNLDSVPQATPSKLRRSFPLGLL